jgi:transcriptional regulator with XRE-family HTH domain
MLSPTLREGLKSYAIGPKIRAIRLKKKIGLVELGRHTGLSAAMLSKIERGTVFPTLPTLLRIALVFSVGLDFFFSGSRDQPVVGVVRHKDRLRFPEKPGARDSTYVFESLDYPAVERRLNGYFVEFMQVPEARRRLHQHDGGEFIYVLGGTLTVQVGGEVHTLQPRDSMYFDSSTPHGYSREGTKTCTAIVVTTA